MNTSAIVANQTPFGFRNQPQFPPGTSTKEIMEALPPLPMAEISPQQSQEEVDAELFALAATVHGRNQGKKLEVEKRFYYDHRGRRRY